MMKGAPWLRGDQQVWCFAQYLGFTLHLEAGTVQEMLDAALVPV